MDASCRPMSALLALGVPLDYTRALDYFHGRVMQAKRAELCSLLYV